MIQERDRALAECEDLRRRLGAVAGIVGAQHPSLNGTLFTFEQLIDSSILTDDYTELAALTAQQSPLPLAARPQNSPGTRYDNQLHPDLRSSSSHGLPANRGASVESPGSSSWSNEVEKSSSQQQYPNSNESPYDQQRTAAAPMRQQGNSNGDRLGLNFLLESTDQRQDTHNSTPTTPSFNKPPQPDQPLYARLTNVGPPSCPLDYLLLDAHKSLRKMLLDGASLDKAIGPEYPAFSSMMSTGPGPRPPCHQISALLIDILSKFPDIARLPEKVAVLYVMFLILRWMISPTQECYERLPTWCRPTPEQLERPHVAWGDYLPW